MNVLACKPRHESQWLQQVLRASTGVANGYAGRHPWQLAAAGAALGAVGAMLLRRLGERLPRQPRQPDYSDGF